MGAYFIFSLNINITGDCPVCGRQSGGEKRMKHRNVGVGSFSGEKQYLTEKKKLMAMIAQVIKYEGNNQTFIWKHPCEDFNSGTQLIVHESQEAVFFMNGQALDSFGPGRYTLFCAD